MSVYSVAINFDDEKEAASIAALQKIDAGIEGESTLEFLQRVILESLLSKIADGQARIAQETIASQIQDPGVTISNE